MPAPVGNQFWKARSTHGRSPIFASPDDLWAAAVEYFEWVETNPLYEAKPFAYQGAVTIESVAKMRAMTITGLCIFLDISMQAWSEYKQREGFGEITTRVDEIIRTQKFEGASADLLNANIIARDLGLADKSELNVAGSLHTMSGEDLDARIALLLEESRTGAAPGGASKTQEP
ncbi:DNA-packaging protein [Mesorhizobium sp. M0915]|uniref:DNA-packaging protein n=1 Tax=Mesorhizobium sp. M0915 TaxID=2957027 RepID=UPI00333C62C4